MFTDINSEDPLVPAPFSDFAILSHELISNLEKESERLRAARDLLLPRLMSREVAV
jgi:hypothetical protein